MSFRIVANPLPVAIEAQLFAALDACDELCWTDDAFHAARFDTPSEAESFGRTWIDGDDWRVVAL